MLKIVKKFVINKSESNNHGWISEWLKGILERNKTKEESGLSEEENESSSSSGEDGGIKIPVLERPDT